MRYLLILLSVFLLVLSYVTAPVHEAIAVVQMDGLGWYRVDNYELKDNKCVHFIDGVGEKVEFCGAFTVTDKWNFHKLYE